ncbi:rheacalcin-1-like [Anabas testudineus]|uniref:rheacalcin-1-like n=1 Tax=Anabas testudineus TaxID=64144 RepID=UPI000E462C10|nr:rheacalcin-1-like [Anabas testudineus]
MKTLLIFSVVLCVALSIRAATDLVAVPAYLPQARVQFCLDGWLGFRGNCYLLVNHPDTWRNAESYCADFDANLASVHNIWEYNFLQRTVNTGGHTFAWIGGYYFQGNWRWEDGSMVNYNKWGSMTSPDICQCMQLNSQDSKGWSNQACNVRLPFVCQTNPNC